MEWNRKREGYSLGRSWGEGRNVAEPGQPTQTYGRGLPPLLPPPSLLARRVCPLQCPPTLSQPEIAGLVPSRCSCREVMRLRFCFTSHVILSFLFFFPPLPFFFFPEKSRSNQWSRFCFVSLRDSILFNFSISSFYPFNRIRIVRMHSILPTRR